MTDEELLRALGCLGKAVVGTPLCAGCGHEHNCSTRDCAVIREAVERVIDTGWRDTYVEAPSSDDTVLVTVYGRYGSCTFEGAMELARYYEGEGWVLEAYPEWSDPTVPHWRELPEGPGGSDNG